MELFLSFEMQKWQELKNIKLSLSAANFAFFKPHYFQQNVVC
jgi:hypothetical protein